MQKLQLHIFPTFFFTQRSKIVNIPLKLTGKLHAYFCSPFINYNQNKNTSKVANNLPSLTRVSAEKHLIMEFQSKFSIVCQAGPTGSERDLARAGRASLGEIKNVQPAALSEKVAAVNMLKAVFLVYAGKIRNVLLLYGLPCILCNMMTVL